MFSLNSVWLQYACYIYSSVSIYSPKKEHWKLFASEREEMPHGLLPTHNMNHAVAFLQWHLRYFSKYLKLLSISRELKQQLTTECIWLEIQWVRVDHWVESEIERNNVHIQLSRQRCHTEFIYVIILYVSNEIRSEYDFNTVFEMQYSRGWKKITETPYKVIQ